MCYILLTTYPARTPFSSVSVSSSSSSWSSASPPQRLGALLHVGGVEFSVQRQPAHLDRLHRYTVRPNFKHVLGTHHGAHRGEGGGMGSMTGASTVGAGVHEGLAKEGGRAQGTPLGQTMGQGDRYAEESGVVARQDVYSM